LFGRFFRKPLPEPEQLTIAHAGDTLPVTFLRSQRARRASLRVDPAGRRVVLTAPVRMARSTAVDFAHAQAGWIAARLKRLPERRPFADGAEVPLFGEPHRIRHRVDARGTAWREGNEIHVAGRPEHLPRRLKDWLTAELMGRLAPLVHAKAARVGKPVRRITVRDTRSRWGSCAPDGRMSFSWRLVFAPPEVLDYLVAHEVAHLVHHNHSVRFWALARELSAGPIEAPQAWLKANGETLLQYGA
jgi:predicted metal-dependent hydrolase